MECTLVNLHSRSVEFKIRQHQHFRFNPSFPNDPFVIEKTQTLGSEQSTALAATVGSDSAIGRCTFEFKGKKDKVRAAAVVLEDTEIDSTDLDFGIVLSDGKAVATAEAR